MSDDVIIFVELDLKPDTADAFCDGVPTLLEVTAQAPGFRHIVAVRHKENPNRMIFVEGWDSEEAFNAYTAGRVERGEMQIIIDAVATPPKVDIWPTTVARV